MVKLLAQRKSATFINYGKTLRFEMQERRAWSIVRPDSRKPRRGIYSKNTAHCISSRIGSAELVLENVAGQLGIGVHIEFLQNPCPIGTDRFYADMDTVADSGQRDALAEQQ